MKSLQGLKIKSVTRDKHSVNSYDLLLSDGRILHAYTHLLSKPKKPAAVKETKIVTLTGLLHEKGSHMYIDKRKNDWRVKVDYANVKLTALCKEIKKLKLSGVSSEIEKVQIKRRFQVYDETRLIIRTAERPSQVLLNK